MLILPNKIGFLYFSYFIFLSTICNAQEKLDTVIVHKLKEISKATPSLIKATTEHIDFLEKAMDTYESNDKSSVNPLNQVTEESPLLDSYDEADTIIEEESDETVEDMRAFYEEIILRTKETGITSIDEFNECEEAATLLGLDLETFKKRHSNVKELLANPNKQSTFIKQFIKRNILTAQSDKKIIYSKLLFALDEIP